MENSRNEYIIPLNIIRKTIIFILFVLIYYLNSSYQLKTIVVYVDHHWIVHIEI
jgi:hypothetical protein